MSKIKLVFKRFFVFVLLFTFGIVTSSSGVVNADEFVYSYEVNAPDMTDEELVEQLLIEAEDLADE